MVRFRSSDGVDLAGLVFGRGDAGVVLAHDKRADLCQWLPEAHALAAAGWHVLAFDARGHGASASAPTENARWRIDLDVEAAADELRTLGGNRLALIGASMGGTASIVASGAVEPPVRAVAGLSAPATFYKLDGIKTVKRSTVPLLLVVGARDEDFPDEAKHIDDTATGSYHRVETIPRSAAHGTELLDGRDRTTVDGDLRRFLLQFDPPLGAA